MSFYFSPAKVNLFFRVLGKRGDGYHEIASLYQAIDLGDELKVELTQERDILVCQNSQLPCDSSNLILKASALFRARTHLPIYAKFSLLKTIPIEAGLGGGSSNAATTLWALNELCDHPATIEELKSWGQELGSDVPFFLSQGTAYCTGRGEILEEIEKISSLEKMWIVKPSYGLSTPKVYQTCAACLFEPRSPKEALAGFRRGSPQFFNDLEIPAFKLIPELQKLKEQLRVQGFRTVTMTGSGTAFVCVGDIEPENIPEVSCYPVSWMRRERNTWYSRSH